MNIKNIVGASVVATLLIAGSAAAQVVPGGTVTIGTTPVSTTITPGTANANLGTVTLTGDAQGATIGSLAITIAPAGGGSLSNLTNCRLINTGGTAVTSNIGTLSGSTNTFTFTPVLTVGGSSGTRTLSLRCDVSATAPAGATFAFSAPVTANSNLGNVQIVGAAGGSFATSIPITITPSAGGSTSVLSNCRLANSSGVAVTNTLGGVVTGVNTFTFNPQLSVGGSAGNANLTLRCDIAAGNPAGVTFQSTAGAPSLTPFVTPTFSVNLDIAPTAPRGSNDLALANISIGNLAGGANVNVSAIPVSLSSSGGASVGSLTGCTIRNTTNLDGSLSGTFNANAGTNTFVFSTPLTVFAGTAPMLALTCDIAAATPIGGAFTISIDPASVTAKNAATGAVVTPAPVVGIGPNGLPAATSGTLLISGDVGADTGTGTGTGTPGVPNTGLGGNAMQMFYILALAGLIALAGGLYVHREIR